MSKFFTRALVALCVALTLAPLAQAGVITPPFNPANSIPYTYNVTPTNLRHWIKARNAARNGSAEARVVWIGNSKTAGLYSESGSSSLRTHSPPAYFAAALAAHGLPVNSAAMVATGDPGFTIAQYAAYNTNVTLGTGWVNSAVNSLGGRMFQAPASGDVTTALTYTSPITADTFLIGYAVSTSLGNYTYSLNGGAASSPVVTAGASGTYATKTVSVARGASNSIAINRVTGTGDVYIGFILPYDSTTKAIEVWNAGWGSSTSNDWADAAIGRSPLNVLKTVAPDLTIIKGPTNDYTPAYGPVSLSTFTTNLQNIITAAKVSGDCAVVAEAPSAPSRQTQAIQDQYNAVMKNLAATNGCAFFDVPSRLNGYAAANAQSYYVDDTHLYAIGYSEEGYWVGDVLAGL